jgi:hypothetical protein
MSKGAVEAVHLHSLALPARASVSAQVQVSRGADLGKSSRVGSSPYRGVISLSETPNSGKEVRASPSSYSSIERLERSRRAVVR